jgi:bifunctional non-homologous end joining protein LigD
MPRRKDDSADEKLRKYRAKRSADRTPEPFGGEAVPTVPADAVLSPEPAGAAAAPSAAPAWAKPRLFCIQKHAATRLHYDFRLEIGGVLRSWAVPMGPSLNPADKRLAMEVEDHPVEYADFEGVIPEGNYGAGEVIVWDKGLWVPTENPDETLPLGKVSFELHGYKLRGAWHLFRIKGRGQSTGKEWMLIKRNDPWASATRALPAESIYSGLTLEEIRTGSARAGEVRAELEAHGAPKQRVRAASVKLMLAETGEKAFDDPAWVFELKYDGYRVLATREEGAPHLVYRKGSDATAIYPDVARALQALPFGDLVIDGEVVVLDEEGRPSFQRLQRRAQQRRTTDIQRSALELPATFYAFDLVAFEDFDLRPLPLVERKRLLQKLLPRAGPVRYVDHIAELGEAFYEEVGRLKLEGLIAKRADSPYRAGRSPHWLKLRTKRSADFAVVGFTEPAGGRTGFGALHVAAFDAGALVYCGRAGSGFDEEQLVSLRGLLDGLRRKTPACSGPLPKGREHVWVEPQLVVEVRYLTWTAEGLLRQPVFLRLRDDKPLEECVVPADRAREMEGAASGEAEGDSAEGEDEGNEPPSDAAAARAAEPARHEEGGARPDTANAGPGLSSLMPDPPVEKKVPFTNLTKVFWPDEKYTKGDLIDYYRAISPWLLPYLEDRLLVLTRYPDGVKGKSFFQKDAPSFAPGWMRTERVWSEDGQREIDYFVAGDVESLLYIANLGTIPLHVWASRITDLAHPDWCILDLDPKSAPFLHVVQVARGVRALTDEIGLPAYVKTSGSTGLHVLVPLGGLCTFEQCKQLGELLARVVAGRLPEIATTIRLPGERGGRVYIDFLQNGHGKLLAAPFTARPVPGALCSAPLRWDEVDDSLDIRAFALKTLPGRMAALGEDPLAPVLAEKPDLVTAIGRLAGLVAG